MALCTDVMIYVLMFLFFFVQDISGCDKFRKKPIQNEDLLREMFRNITNEEADHWNPFSDNPIIPTSQEQPFDVDDTEYVDGENNA